MGSKKYLKFRLCDCTRYYPDHQYYGDAQREKTKREISLTVLGYLIFLLCLHFLSTIRPLFFISYGTLLEPCNGTNILPFDQFQNLVDEYIRLKNIMNNIQTSHHNLQAVSHFHESYPISKVQAFEDLIKSWVIVEDTYKIQQKKYKACYYRNRQKDYESLQQIKWLIYTYFLLLLLYCLTNCLNYYSFRKELSKTDLKRLLGPERPGVLTTTGMAFVALTAPLPGYFLPKVFYFFHYWFIVDGYLGL